ncbi:MAG TPA: ABC transporter ATP-binding protein [Haloplasmataceae bacterium]
MLEKIIELKNINKSYGSHNVFHDLNLTIDRNDFIMIMGKSGCGKSTLLNILGLFDKPDKGDYFLLGENITNYKRKHQLRNEMFGFVFQMYYLVDDYTVIDNILLPIYYSPKKTIDEEKVTDLLKKMDIYHLKDKAVKYLSGGEKQRVAILRAIINEPQIIFCDEPTGNLDSENTNIIINFLQEQNQKGKTIVMVTHDSNLIDKAKKVYLIESQKITSL